MQITDNDYQFLRVKDMQRLLNVSNDCAKKHYQSIKKEYDLKTKPTLFHLRKYLKMESFEEDKD